jgi:hypothetical protein
VVIGRSLAHRACAGAFPSISESQIRAEASLAESFLRGFLGDRQHDRDQLQREQTEQPTSKRHRRRNAVA